MLSLEQIYFSMAFCCTLLFQKHYVKFRTFDCIEPQTSNLEYFKNTMLSLEQA